MSGPARIVSLYRYPVKGLSGEKLKNVSLGVGETFPADRSFAIENGPSGFDPVAPNWQPKIKFLCLMRNAKLAALETNYDDTSGTLTVIKDGVPMVEASLKSEAGRAAIEYFFHDFMGREARGALKVLESPGHSFSDVSAKVAHVVNLATVRDLSASVGREIHPLRFRANIYLEGWAPWSEFDLIGKTIRAGSVDLKITKKVVRCAATEVNPENAERDIDVPEAIWRKTGETDLGVYARVVTAGNLAEGDSVEMLD
ncbi:MAG: MOSC domain-containing protein [Xanthobacteraceae bacterium]|nr:MOSC domain-containing protein [Xanthobacteraceae bacterium]MCW5677940.1 MOSC domain-containing protein [Xanthobacteraceae bacterium]